MRCCAVRTNLSTVEDIFYEGAVYKSSWILCLNFTFLLMKRYSVLYFVSRGGKRHYGFKIMTCAEQVW